MNWWPIFQAFGNGYHHIVFMNNVSWHKKVYEWYPCDIWWGFYRRKSSQIPSSVTSENKAFFFFFFFYSTIVVCASTKKLFLLEMPGSNGGEKNNTQIAEEFRCWESSWFQIDKCAYRSYVCFFFCNVINAHQRWSSLCNWMDDVVD